MQFVIIILIFLGIGIGVIAFFLVKSFIAPHRVASLENLYKQGKYAHAIKTAKLIIAKEPRNSEAHYFLGLVYLAEGKHELALMELKTVNQLGEFTKLCPEVKFRRTIAELYRRFHLPEEALKEYLLLIKQEPAVADHYFNAGEMFEERGKTDKALGYYRKTVELQPGHGEALFRLGLLLYRLKKPLEAKEYLEKALRYQPENAKIYYYLGKILKDNHDYVAALVAFEKAQRDNELKIKALIERGACYMSTNNFDKAIPELERASKLSDNDAATEVLYGRYFLAACYEKIRDIDKAIENWEKIYMKKPAFRDVAEKLSQYQDLRTDDRMKDYLTANMEDYYAICKSVTIKMGLGIRDISDIPNGCQIIAVEGDSKWRATKKMPKLLWFLRVPELIPETTVRALHEQMKQLSVTRGVIVSSSNFSRKALDFSESRSINLIGKDRLQEILKTADDSPS
ncbi:MAG: tetratricopeptide repeat protein [Spirochaetales bacterium]|nr:tetratricopeptide repeat protein [Spirochaetales bacterium]